MRHACMQYRAILRTPNNRVLRFGKLCVSQHIGVYYIPAYLCVGGVSSIRNIFISYIYTASSLRRSRKKNRTIERRQIGVMDLCITLLRSSSNLEL